MSFVHELFNDIYDVQWQVEYINYSLIIIIIVVGPQVTKPMSNE